MRPVLNSDLRHALRRGVAACLATAIFASSGGAVLAGQVCMHHGGPSTQTADVQPPVDESATAHVGHGSAGAHVAAAADDRPTESHDAGACTCLGACQTAATAEVPVTPDVARVPAPADVVDETVPADLLPRSSQSTWFLPPSNGPPALT